MWPRIGGLSTPAIVLGTLFLLLSGPGCDRTPATQRTSDPKSAILSWGEHRAALDLSGMKDAVVPDDIVYKYCERLNQQDRAEQGLLTAAAQRFGQAAGQTRSSAEKDLESIRSVLQDAVVHVVG